MVYNHVVEEVNDHDELGPWGFGFNYFGGYKRRVVKKD